MTFCIAFHSYKGGTGKTTIASNLSAHLANQGSVVVLLDLDLYSPSLHTYFRITPEKWINDFLYSSAKVKDIIFDLPLDYNRDEDAENNNLGASKLKGIPYSKRLDEKGRLLLGLANSKMENFQQLDVSGIEAQKHFFRKLVLFRDQIISKFNPDYIIFDTSPGVRYWSLNTLAISDMFLLTLKMGDIDIEGTQIMINEIYNSFMDSGTKSFLVWNKVAGYCIPHSNYQDSSKLMSLKLKGNGPTERIDQTSDEEAYDLTSSSLFGLNIMSSIPCFCDIQFKKREYLTTSSHPGHPFSQRVSSLAEHIDAELNNA
jgi:MinD-like ATPase involved in chromosome partitioning or flagellar assembly